MSPDPTGAGWQEDPTLRSRMLEVLTPGLRIVSGIRPTLQTMWEDPTALWRRLKLGREEYLQRLVTTLILDGTAPPWNSPRPPGELGRTFLGLLDDLAHRDSIAVGTREPATQFVDEYLLPRLDESAANGWPDWAVLWDDRVWIIELKTEAGSHRADQLPYYLTLAAAAHAQCSLDLTYITGPLEKPAPVLQEGQRYCHLTWDEVLPLVTRTWSQDPRPEVGTYVEMVRTVVGNLSRLKPAAQRAAVIGGGAEAAAAEPGTAPPSVTVEATSASGPGDVTTTQPSSLVDLARATATDGRQRALGVASPEELEALRDRALAEIDQLAAEDPTRFVLPWLWHSARTGGRALTPEGREFGYELRLSRYKTIQVRPSP